MIKIRKANCEDGPNVSQLLKSKYNFKSIDEAREIFKSECLNQHYRIAYNKDEIIGLISWRTQGTINHGVVELTRITVSENVIDSLPVKELLFDVMIAEADYFYKQHGSKLRKVFSLIHSDNKHVKTFFEDKGMKQEAVLKHHYHNGRDELVFSMFLR